MKVIELREGDSEEELEIWIADDNPGGYDVEIASFNHDLHGWAGIGIAEEVAYAIGKALGITVRRA